MKESVVKLMTHQTKGGERDHFIAVSVRQRSVKWGLINAIREVAKSFVRRPIQGLPPDRCLK